MSDLLFDLWLNFLQVGMFSIGGGYSVVALIQNKIVDAKQWLTLKEYTDVLAISQMTPGPLAVNASSFTGLKVAGLSGAVVATFGCVIFGIVVSLSCYRFFCAHRESATVQAVLKALKSVALGLIASAGAGILLLSLTGGENEGAAVFDYKALGIAAVSMVLLRPLKVNPVAVMAFGAVAGVFLY